MNVGLCSVTSLNEQLDSASSHTCWLKHQMKFQHGHFVAVHSS